MARGTLLVLAVVFLLAGGTDALPPDGIQHGHATWSESPDGKGWIDGSCGYAWAFKPMIRSRRGTAGFGTDEKDETGCGACFDLICTGHPACSDSYVGVTVTDSCRDTKLCGEGVFEIPRVTFGGLAKEGREEELLQSLIVSVNYTWIDCSYDPFMSTLSFPAFRVHPRASSSDFAVIVVFLEGLAVVDTVIVELKNKGEDAWHQMQRTHGATWNFTSPDGSKLLPVTAPLSFRVTIPKMKTTPDSHPVVTANDVIPDGWKPGEIYYQNSRH